MTISTKETDIQYTDELPPFTFNQTGMLYSDSNYILNWNDGDVSGKLGFHIEDDIIYLQSCLTDFGNKTCFSRIIKYLFKNFRPKSIECHYCFYNFFNNLDDDHNFSVELPSSVEELLLREDRKKRYNLRRERRILANLGVDFCEVDRSEFEAVVKVFFKYKKNTHGREWNLSPEVFLKWLNITNIYALKKGDDYIAFALSDEHFNKVIFQQTSYDLEWKRYSPGSVLYLYFLEEMIRKGNAEVFLGGGYHEYKKMFGSREDFTFNGSISRHYVFKGVCKTLHDIASRIKYSFIQERRKK